MRTNISEVWESIRRHVQNRRFRQIWSQFRPLSGQVASRGWIYAELAPKTIPTLQFTPME